MSAKPASGSTGDVNGVLLLDKSTGITSNHALQKVRQLFGRAKAGHTGTLDPLASGLLPICFGEATKFSQSLLDSEKTYRAVVQLGWLSSTGDAEGDLTAVSVPDIADARLEAVVREFTGEISQVPPMYSALKRAGKPLYELARQGITVDRAPRTVVIRELKLLNRIGNELVFDVTCSKGTYIRVLSEALGEALGCAAYLKGLRRTAVAGFGLDRSVTLDQLEAADPAGRHRLLLPVDAMLATLPMLELGSVEAERMRRGQSTSVGGEPAAPGPVRLYGPQAAFLGIGEIRDDGLVHPKRLVSQAFV